MAIKVDDEEAEAILEELDKGADMKSVAFKFGRDHSTISRIKKRFHPTAKLATRLIKASAMELAQRVIDKADVNQALDILSRPNIDVLKPQSKGDSGGTGIFISVGNDSLGAYVGSTPANFIEGKVENVIPEPVHALPAPSGIEIAREAREPVEGAVRVGDGESPKPKRTKRPARHVRDSGNDPGQGESGVVDEIPNSVVSKTSVRVAITGRGKDPKRSGIHLRYDV